MRITHALSASLQVLCPSGFCGPAFVGSVIMLTVQGILRLSEVLVHSCRPLGEVLLTCTGTSAPINLVVIRCPIIGPVINRVFKRRSSRPVYVTNLFKLVLDYPRTSSATEALSMCHQS